MRNNYYGIRRKKQNKKIGNSPEGVMITPEIPSEFGTGINYGDFKIRESVFQIDKLPGGLNIMPEMIPFGVSLEGPLVDLQRKEDDVDRDEEGINRVCSKKFRECFHYQFRSVSCACFTTWCTCSGSMPYQSGRRRSRSLNS